MFQDCRARGDPARVPQGPHRERRRSGPLGPPGQARGFPKPRQGLHGAATINYASAIHRVLCVAIAKRDIDPLIRRAECGRNRNAKEDVAALITL